MPYDGSGNFSRVHNWTDDKTNGIKIVASRHDEEDNGFATAFNQVMMRSGVTPFTGNANLGTNSLIGIGSGMAGAPSMRFGADPTTGIYMPAYGQVGLTAQGVERFQVNSAGAAVTGTLTVSGNTTLTGTLTVSSLAVTSVTASGNIGAATMTTTGLMSPNTLNVVGTAAVGGLASLNAGVTVTGNAGISGNVTAANVTAATGVVKGAQLTVDGLFSMFVSGNPYLNVDTGDYYVYDRSGNTHAWRVAEVNLLEVSANGVNLSSTVRTTSGVFAGALTPGTGRAALETSGTSAQTGFVSFTGSDNARRGYIGFVSTTGAADMNYANDVGGGHSFAQTVKAPRFQLNSTSAMYLSDGSLVAQFDTGDYLYYDAIANKYHFAIGGVSQASIDGTGTLRMRGNVIANTTP
jgi:hypothetical protein